MKYGFLFGAGAEVGYDMPSGGKFALEIFRYDSSKSKEKFKKMREEIAKTNLYATEWLPRDYYSKNISSYGKSVFENIIKDTIECGRSKIIKQLNTFDKYAEKEACVLNAETGKNIREILESRLNDDLENYQLGQTVSFIDAFSEGNALFKNHYFSALLFIYKDKTIMTVEDRSELGKILTAILQLQIGALSEKLSSRISDNMFSQKDDEIDIFDDLGDSFQLNYQASGLAGMEYLLEKRTADTRSESGIILRFAQCIIESIYASVLDYKSLIDTNWHYLYSPRYDWAKFCKISIFLLTVQEYILEQVNNANFNNPNGYYHQLAKAIDDNVFEVSKVATTNYSDQLEIIIKKDTAFLNGSTELWYDPYLNRIGKMKDFEREEKHFLVPLMFTQSGTKPMTSIDMSKQYVDTYNQWKESDAIVAIGFGFNVDDEHINGIIRTLIDIDDKQLIVVVLEQRKKMI